MKKIVSMLLMCALLCASVCALAGGEITCKQKTFLTVEGYSSCTSYVYAEIENTGNKNVTLDKGTFAVMDEDSGVIESGDIYYCYPEVLAPGDTGYIIDTCFLWDTEDEDEVASYSLKLLEEDTKQPVHPKIHSEAEFIPDDEYSTRIMITVTNDTKKTVNEPQIIVALYDDEGKLLYADVEYIYNVGIPAGGTIYCTCYISSDIVNTWDVDFDKITATSMALYPED